MLWTISKLSKSGFSSVRHLRGKSQLTSSQGVQLRGIHLAATTKDAPTMIFIPEIFDQAENWVPFFLNSQNRILEERNVYILYPRNFGNSDRCNEVSLQEMADDVARFMYQNRISMATLAGHGIGGKIALATSCYHYDKVTGYIGIDTSPMNHFYHQPVRQLRDYISFLRNLNLHRSFSNISLEIRRNVKCPKWRHIFQSSLVREGPGYQWKFNLEPIYQNIKSDSPSSLFNWSSLYGLYTGRSMFVFPEYSRYVHLGTNTLPMMKVCPQLHGWNEGISSVQGDENPQNHWVYEADDQTQTAYAFRIRNFLRHYDGVHVLLKNRAEVGGTTIPDIANARNPRDEVAGEYQPAHYYHNWRFNNVYNKEAK